MPGDPRVYLAGPIQHAADNGHGWRDWIVETVEGYDWINPHDHAEPTDDEIAAGDYSYADIVETDKRLIDESDAVLVGWTRVPSVGTPMEMLYAFDRDVPVAVWFEPEGSTESLETRTLSPWLRYHAVAVETGLAPALNALERAIVEAQGARA